MGTAADPALAVGVEGLTTVASSFEPKMTMDRFEAATKGKGMTVFARIDHAAGAKDAGLPLRATELLIFGNAKGGTPLMQASQTIGIDLPLKALVWQDESGKVWLSYSDPAWLAERHGIAATTERTVTAMTVALSDLAHHATTAP